MKNYSTPSIHNSSYPPGGDNPGGYNPGGGYNQGGYQPGQYQPGGYTPAPQYQQYPGQFGEPAGAGPRILAYLVDGLLVSGIYLIGYLLFIVFAVGGAATNSESGAQAGGMIGSLFLLITIPAALAVALINSIYIAGKNNGQTIGKKMMKIRIVKENGTPFTYMDGFLRNIIGYWISSLVCWLGFIWALFDSRKQAWHDKIFHTQVVRA